MPHSISEIAVKNEDIQCRVFFVTYCSLFVLPAKGLLSTYGYLLKILQSKVIILWSGCYSVDTSGVNFVGIGNGEKSIPTFR